MSLSPALPSRASVSLGVASRSRLAPPDHVGAVPLVHAQPTLTLTIDRAPDLPARPRLTLVRDPDSGMEHFAARFAQAVTEVIAGERGPQQLIRWTSAEVYHDLLERGQALHHLKQGVVAAPRSRVRPKVHSVHVAHPSPDVAEVSIHIHHGDRSRALALRFDREDDRWRCTALELG